MGGCCVGNCCVMNNPVGDFFRDIFSSGSGCGYHPGPSETEQHAKKIADELAEMKEHIRESTERDEAALLDYVNRSMDSFLEELRTLNLKKFGGKSLRIDIEGLKKEKERLKTKVKGHIGDKMDQRLVQTDKELSLILEERDDKKRAKSFDRFVEKIKRQALESLQNEIRKTVNAQSNMVEREIKARISEVEKSLEETSRAYSDILKAKETGGAQLEAQQIKYMYHCELYSLLLEQTEEH